MMKRETPQTEFKRQAYRKSEAHERLLSNAVASLKTHLNKFVGKPFTKLALQAIDNHVQEAARFLASHGVELPQLHAIVIPSRGWIDIVRDDLSEASVAVIVNNLFVRFPGIDPREVFPAVRAVFPQYAGGLN